MGLTRFSGPVYGAKSLLWSYKADNIAVSTAASTVTSLTIPAGQEWFVTDFHAFRGSTFSTAFVITLLDDSTVVANLAITSSLAAQSASTTPTATAGEYEGVQIAGLSTVTMTVQNAASSAAGSSDVQAWAYGYIRFVSSTRSEG